MSAAEPERALLFEGDGGDVTDQLVARLAAEGLPFWREQPRAWMPQPGQSLESQLWDVWVPRAELERAQALVRELLEATDVAPGVWRCPACGEACEAAFEACWSCGAERGSDVAIVEPARPAEQRLSGGVTLGRAIDVRSVRLYLLFAAAMTSWFAARGLLERTPDLGPLEGWRDRLPLAGPLVVALLAPWWLLARVRPEGDSGSDAQD